MPISIGQERLHVADRRVELFLRQTLHTPEDGPRQVRPDEDGVEQVGPFEVGTRQVRPVEPGADRKGRKRETSDRRARFTVPPGVRPETIAFLGGAPSWC